jgi:hypothetical protein
MADRITRRGALGSFLLLPTLSAPRAARAAVLRPIETRLALLAASNRKSARAIGRAYLRLRPDEALAANLPAMILSRLKLDARGAQALDDWELRARLESAIRTDFARYDTDMLGGWVLARTELKLCALVALGY